MILLTTLTALHGQPRSQPHVHIITTGGTIASRSGDAMLDGPSLVREIPELGNLAHVTVEEFVRIGSSKMTPQIWLDLAKYIAEFIEKYPNVESVVITHGTDSMEETAFFLHLAHRSVVPVIFTGAMRTSDQISADGPGNLLDAVRTGVSGNASGMGVLLVMNGTISSARDVIKAHNNRVAAFQSPDYGPVGSVDGSAVHVTRTLSTPHTTQSTFDVYQLNSLPNVELVTDFTGANPDILEAFLDRDNDGLVVASFAGGRLSPGFTNTLANVAFSKPVVIASNIKGGHISAYSDKLIFAGNLPPNKARILLMLALTLTDDVDRLQAIFDNY